jgi:DNA-binding transcriptional LysR family regulator
MALDWNDLRTFVIAAREQSFAGGARRLGVDPATVGRRIARLEAALRSTLVVRSATGLQLTAAGERLLEAGLTAEIAMTAAEQTGEADIGGGNVRISASEGFGTAVLAPALPQLRAERPGMKVELAAGSGGFLSASRREVDIAVTLSASGDTRLVTEPLTDYQLALYATPEYLRRAGPLESTKELRRHSLIGYVEDLIFAPELRYLEEIDPSLRPVLASSSIRAQETMIRNSGGVGVLPCFLAEGLIRLLPGDVLLTRRFWMGTHRDLSGSARIRTVQRWMKDLVRANEARLSPH